MTCQFYWLLTRRRWQPLITCDVYADLLRLLVNAPGKTLRACVTPYKPFASTKKPRVSITKLTGLGPRAFPRFIPPHLRGDMSGSPKIEDNDPDHTTTNDIVPKGNEDKSYSRDKDSKDSPGSASAKRRCVSTACTACRRRKSKVRPLAFSSPAGIDCSYLHIVWTLTEAVQYTV